MPKCSVKTCKNNTLTTLKKDGISYFRFPKHEIEREKWRIIIANERNEDFFKPNDSSVVCSGHFSENDMYNTKKGFRKLKKGVCPCIAIETSTTQFQYVSPGSAMNEPSTCRVGDNSEKKKPVEAVPQNKQITEQDLVHRCLPPPTLSGLTSTLDTIKTSYYKKSLIKYKKTIVLKNKQIQNLRKKNKRLMKRNLTLKEMVANLKKKRLIDESLNNDSTKKIDSKRKIKERYIFISE